MTLLNVQLVALLCFSGYTLISGDDEPPKIVWAEVFVNEGRSRISSLPADPVEYIDNSTITTSYRYQATGHNFLAITGDYEAGLIFFSDAITRNIYVGSLIDGVDANAIHRGTSQTVEGIAVDWVAKNVYWCDAGYDWIMVANYSGLNARILIDTGLDKPRDLVVYPQKGTMYWTDWGVNVTSISMSTLAGEGVRELITDNLHYPNGLTIDYATDSLFWVDANPPGSRIETVHLDGTGRRLIFMASQDQAHFFDVVSFLDYLFVTDWFGNLQIVNRTSGGHHFSLALGTKPHGIMTYGPGLLPAYPTSPCVPNPCDQLCVHDSEPGDGYKCMCGHGYQIGGNGTCIQEEGALVKPRVLLLSKTKLCHYPGNFPDLSFPNGYEAPCLVRDRTHTVALAVDVRADWVFFSDFQLKRLYGTRLLLSSPVEAISGAIGSVEGIAVDYINQNLYWTDYQLNHIVVANYDGSHRVTLVDTDIIKPRNLVIHMETRMLFWTELGPPYEIEQADLDGQNRRVLVTLTYSPSGLAYDYVTGRLVYGETGSGTIYSYHIASDDHSVLHTRLRHVPFFDMEIFGDYLMWTEWGASNGIHALNLETGAVHQSQLVLDEAVYGVRMYADVKQRANVTTADCGEDNGRCSQLCVGTATSYRCYCSTGFQLGDDGRTCQTGALVADKFALVTDSFEKTVFQVDLESETHNFTGMAIPELKNPIAIDYDPIAEKVYVSDVIGKKIVRANLDGTMVEVIASEDIMTPDGLAVDYVSRLLYWTDTGLDTISVAHLDGTHQRSLITQDLDEPRAIVLDPFEGVMFWSDWGIQPKIEKGYMDGTYRETIVSTDIAWPNGLAIDRTASRLYWCDAKTDRIETSLFDGTDRRVFLEEGVVHPFGIAVFEDFVYWTEWTSRGLMRADRTSPGDETRASLIGSESFLRLNGITIFSRSNILTGTTQCTTDNGGCGQLCLLSPGGRTCQCEDGSDLLDDGVNCQERETRCPMIVPNGEFPLDCDRMPGDQCSVVCEERFNSSLTHYMCLEGLAWNYPPEHICEAIECPFQQPTSNVEVNQCLPPHRYNSICSFRCRDGFTYHNGSDERRCRQDGTWSGEEMFCGVITCPALTPPANGMFQPQACMDGVVTRDEECRLSCSQGYQSRGSIVLLCLPSGTYSIDLSYVECVDTTPPVFSNGCPTEAINVLAPEGQVTYPYAGTDLGAVDNSEEVTVVYSLPPESTISLEVGLHIFIQTARDPSGNTAICDYFVNVTVNHCPYLPIPFNSDMSGGCPTFHGAICNFSCNDGFRLVGNGSATCVMSSLGEFIWDSSSPYCEAVICPEPEISEGAIREGCAAPYSPNHRCDFLCDRGYGEDGGSDSRTCEDSGQWSGTPLQCTRKKCPSLQPLQNGIIHPPECSTDGLYTGEVCTYSCDEGFQLEGSPQRICSIDGTWVANDADRTCIDINGPHFNGTCPRELTLIALPGQTTAIANWTDPTVIDDEGRVLNITSNPQQGSFLSEGIHTVVIQALDDSNNRGFCFFTIEVKVIRCTFLGDAIYNDCNTLLGSTCTVSCTPGYRLLGSAMRTCEWDNVSEYGTWSGEGTSCEAITCPRLEVPEGAHTSDCNFDVDRAPYGFICTLSCQEGYSEFEGVQKKCSENGTWVGSDLVCTPVTCGAIYPAEHSSVEPVSCQNRTQYLDTCTFSCEEGYSIAGNENRTCLGNGQWNFDGQPPTCHKDAVEPPEEPACPDHLDLTVSEPCTRVATLATWEWTPTASLVRVLNLTAGIYNMSVLLLSDSNDHFSCIVEFNVTVTTCPRLTSDLLTGLTCSYTYGSEATFACSQGGRLVGSNTSVCQDDGSWRSEVPTCEVVICPRPDIPDGFRTTSECEQTVGYTQFCSIECLPNQAVSSSYIVCGVDGIWLNFVDSTTYDPSGPDISDCVDMTPPEITCPLNIQRDLPSTGSTVEVTWSLPNVTDNYDSAPIIIIAPPPPPINLTSGSYIKSYRAADSRNNTAGCTFIIEISDVTPPISHNCTYGTVIQPVDSILEPLMFEMPAFTDNVGVVDESADRSGKVGTYGPIPVTYSASDAAGNTGSCSFTVIVVELVAGSYTVGPWHTTTVGTDCTLCTVYVDLQNAYHTVSDTRDGECPVLAVPTNGAKTCDGPNRCVINCNPGYSLLNSRESSVLYICLGNEWQNGLNGRPTPFPSGCGVVRWNPRRGDSTSFSIENGTCLGNEEELKQTFLELFNQSRYKMICDSHPNIFCNVSNMQVECGNITSETTRRKRQAVERTQVTITYVVHGSSNTTFDALDRAFNLSVTGFFGDANTLVLDDGTRAVLVPESSQQGELLPHCLVGSQAFGLTCITCPAGTYFHVRTQTCTTCPVGQYQNEPGQSQCNSCHGGYSTRGPGAPSSEYCKRQCQSGEYSYSGLVPCRSCPYGTYQPAAGSRGCLFCTEGTNTSGGNSTAASDCEVVVMTTAETIPTKDSQKPDEKDGTKTIKEPSEKTETPKSGDGGHWVWLIIGLSTLVGFILLLVLLVYIKRRKQGPDHSCLFHSQETSGDKRSDGHSLLKVSGDFLAFQNSAFSEMDC